MRYPIALSILLIHTCAFCSDNTPSSTHQKVPNDSERNVTRLEELCWQKVLTKMVDVQEREYVYASFPDGFIKIKIQSTFEQAEVTPENVLMFKQRIWELGLKSKKLWKNAAKADMQRIMNVIKIRRDNHSYPVIDRELAILKREAFFTLLHQDGCPVYIEALKVVYADMCKN